MRQFASEVRGVITALLISLAAGLLLALVVYLSPLPEPAIDPLSDFILLASVFAGGATAAFQRGNRGLLRGSLVGLLFFLVMVLLTLFWDPASIALKGLARGLFFVLAAGCLGGIFGVAIAD